MSGSIDPIEFGKMQADISHIKDALDKLTSAIEDSNYVPRKEADERYVLRKELTGLIQLWQFMTSTLGKLVGVAILACVLYLTFKTIEHYPAIKALNNEVQIKEAKE